MTDYYAALMKELGLLRIADAVYEGTRLPLLVTGEQRDWPWEPPARIESTGAILAAIRSKELMVALEIDGREYSSLGSTPSSTSSTTATRSPAPSGISALRCGPKAGSPHATPGMPGTSRDRGSRDPRSTSESPD